MLITTERFEIALRLALAGQDFRYHSKSKLISLRKKKSLYEDISKI